MMTHLLPFKSLLKLFEFKRKRKQLKSSYLKIRILRKKNG